MVLLLVSPLIFKAVSGLKNRLGGSTRKSKGGLRMADLHIWLSNTLHNIGCGLSGGILSQTRPRSSPRSCGCTPKSHHGKSDMRDAGVPVRPSAVAASGSVASLNS